MSQPNPGADPNAQQGSPAAAPTQPQPVPQPRQKPAPVVISDEALRHVAASQTQDLNRDPDMRGPARNKELQKRADGPFGSFTLPCPPTLVVGAWLALGISGQAYGPWIAVCGAIGTVLWIILEGRTEGKPLIPEKAMSYLGQTAIVIACFLMGWRAFYHFAKEEKKTPAAAAEKPREHAKPDTKPDMSIKADKVPDSKDGPETLKLNPEEGSDSEPIRLGPPWDEEGPSKEMKLPPLPGDDPPPSKNAGPKPKGRKSVPPPPEDAEPPSPRAETGAPGTEVTAADAAGRIARSEKKPTGIMCDRGCIHPIGQAYQLPPKDGKPGKWTIPETLRCIGKNGQPCILKEWRYEALE